MGSLREKIWGPSSNSVKMADIAMQVEKNNIDAETKKEFFKLFSEMFVNLCKLLENKK